MGDRRIDEAIGYLRNHPRDPEALRDVRLLLVEAGRRRELAFELTRWAPRAPNDELAARALCEAAELFGEVGEPRRRLRCLVDALWRCPTDEVAPAALREQLEASGDYVYLAELMAEWALALRREGAPPHQCAHASWVTAHVRETYLQDMAGAIEALRDAVEACPSHVGALRALAELYERRADSAMRVDGSQPSSARYDRHRAAELRLRAAAASSAAQARRDVLAALCNVPEHTAALDRLTDLGPRSCEEARACFEAYIEAAPVRVAVLKRRLKLARLLVEHGRAVEAAPHLRELAKHGSREARDLLRRSEAFRDLASSSSGVRARRSIMVTPHAGRATASASGE